MWKSNDSNYSLLSFPTDCDRSGEEMFLNKRNEEEPTKLHSNNEFIENEEVLTGSNLKDIKWNPEKELINIPEDIKWLTNNDIAPVQLTFGNLINSLKIDIIKSNIENEINFCDPEILKTILKIKNLFNGCNASKMSSAKARSYPFQAIGLGIFQNWNAIKMANIDSLCEFMFTNIPHRENEPLYFAEISLQPKGFSEYMLYRNKWEAKGYGFAPKNAYDSFFNQSKMHIPENFIPYYGSEDNGNIMNSININSFIKYVMEEVNDGVHIVLADGEYNKLQGHEDERRIKSKQLHLCECLIALSILRENGHFLIKLLDLFTQFSVGLVYLMSKCFKEISICKPNTSKPGSFERYLICKSKKNNIDAIKDYLFEVNNHMWINKDTNVNVLSLLPYDVITFDNEFFQYICETNNKIGQQQINALEKIAAFYCDIELRETRQNEYSTQCCNNWNLVKLLKVSNETSNTDLLMKIFDIKEKFSEERQKDIINLLFNVIIVQSHSTIKNQIKNIDEWYYYPIVEIENVTLFHCRDYHKIYILTCELVWELLENINIEISPNSLIYGEIVTETIGKGGSQKEIKSLHIIDALWLGGKDMRKLTLNERANACEKFARAHSKQSLLVAPIRYRKISPVKGMKGFFDEVELYGNRKHRLKYQIKTNKETEQRYYEPKGLIFFLYNDGKNTCFSKKMLWEFQNEIRDKSYVVEHLCNY